MKVQFSLVGMFMALFAFPSIGQAASQNNLNVIQVNQEKKQQKDKGNEKSDEDKTMIESEKKVDLNKQNALSMLDILVIKSTKLSNNPQKIKIQAKLGDALWDQDKERAQQLLKEASAAIDTMESSTNSQTTLPTREMLSASRMSLRQEVIQIAARHDFDFAETLRKSITLKTDSENEKSGNKQPINSTEQALQAMRLALSLVKTNPDQAAKIVRNSMNDGINDYTILTLVLLRHDAPQLSTQLFNEAVAKVAATPVLVMDNIGILTNYARPTQEERFTGAVPEYPSWKTAIINFLNFAHSVVFSRLKSGDSEPLVDSEQLLVKQREYSVLQSLHPLFEQYLPSKIKTIRTRIEQLENNLPLKAKQEKVQNEPEKIDVEEILKQAELPTDLSEKDKLYMKASMAASRDGKVDYALSISFKIDNSEDRKINDSIIRYQAGLKALQRGDIDSAYEYAKNITFIPQHALLSNQIARVLLARKSTDRGMLILRETHQWLDEINEDGDVHKAHGLLILAGTGATYAPDLAFEILNSAIYWINKVDWQVPRTKAKKIGQLKETPISIDMLDFEGVFAPLAQTDFNRALSSAQSIQNKDGNMFSEIAICRSILNSVQKVDTQTKKQLSGDSGDEKSTTKRGGIKLKNSEKIK